MTTEITTIDEYDNDYQGEMFLLNTFGSNPENAKTVYNATNNAVALNDYMGVPIAVAGVIMDRGTRSNRSGGEAQPCINTYIVDTEGRAYYSQSAGVARGIAKIASLTDNFSGAPVTIEIGERKLANGNSLKVVNWI